MHKAYTYTSVFANLICAHIQIRRKAGYMYDTEAYWLYRFDQYCVSRNVDAAYITKALYDGWAQRFEGESKTNQYNRLDALKQFSIYLNTLRKASYIPAKPAKT